MLRSINACRSVVLLAVPLGLGACTPNEPVATAPGTPPPVWTGSPAPHADGGHAGTAHGTGAIPGPMSGAPVGPADILTAQLNGPDGNQVAAATIEFRDGVATVMVQTTDPGKLTPGAHGLHIHTVGKCEVNSVAPSGVPLATSFLPVGTSRAADPRTIQAMPATCPRCRCGLTVRRCWSPPPVRSPANS